MSDRAGAASRNQPATGSPAAASAGPTLAEIGEFGLIDRIARGTEQGIAVELGPGDDAAIVLVRGGRVVASTDLLVEGRHFRRDWSTAEQVGRKAAAQNLADIAAMGATPTALLVGLAAPGDLPVEWAAGLARGLAGEAGKLGASVAGGDTTWGETIVIAVTALGDLPDGPAVTRAGARLGDVVALAGELGWSACGLALLAGDRAEAQSANQAPRTSPTIRSAARAKALSRHRVPEPPYTRGLAAARAGATAMIDVSDGLLADLGHIARESGVAIEVDPAAIPLPAGLRDLGAELGADPLGWVLTGGEDHAFAACFPAGLDPLPDGWLRIGSVVGGRAAGDEQLPLVTVAGRGWPGRQGWDHFA